MSDNLKVFTWKEIVENIKSPYNTYVFVGKRNTGKSKSVRNLIVELLNKINHHNIVLFSTTAFKNLNDDYKFLSDNPYAKVFPGDKKTIESNIQIILDHCETMKNKHQNYSILVIFDDIDVTKKNDKVAELFTQGRHYNISVIVSAQSASYFLGPTIRTNIDYLAFRKLENSFKEKLYDACDLQMSFKEFNEYARDNATEFKFIFYDNKSDSKHDEDKLRVVKAVLYEDMKLKYVK